MSGINVTGYLRTESGVGDVARRYVRALRHLNLPIALNDVSALSGNRADDESLGSFESACPHDMNLVCIDVQQQYALLERMGGRWFDGAYNIGVWLWELPEFPERWRDRFAYYDEIWAPSTFIAQVLGPISPVPVVTMPLVLTPEVRGCRQRGRDRLAAAPDERIFLFTFDVNSTLARKHPFAAVDAFKQAFAPTDAARLVLKCVNAKSDLCGMRDLRAAAAGHNVQILDGYWPAADVRDLVEASDAYVSLHRAEGLGLTIADAMAAGKPVVATDWSGSRDFLNARNGFPIGYELVRNQRKAGPYPAGATWAEPSVRDAAAALRRIFDRPDEAQERGQAARQDIDAGFSEQAVARAIADRLDAIRDRRFEGLYRARMRAVYTQYRELGAQLASFVDQHVPAGARVAVVSKGDERLTALNGQLASHFPQTDDGAFAGFHPQDADEAIAHLEDVRARGVEWLLIPATSAWWLQHYQGFAVHLLCRYELVASDDAIGTLVRLSHSPVRAVSEEQWAVRS
jgi:glycosyltransferase involved in cell wall biosynthesis